MGNNIIMAEGRDAIAGGTNSIAAAVSSEGVQIMMGDQGIVLTPEAFEAFAEGIMRKMVSQPAE